MTETDAPTELLSLVRGHLQDRRSPALLAVARLLSEHRCRLPSIPPVPPPVCACFQAADALCPSEGALGAIAANLRKLFPRLQWVADYPGHPVLGAAFGHAVISKSSNSSMGCNLLAARTCYPPHAHLADEVYIPINDSGALFWRERSDSAEPKAPGDIVLHGSKEAHALTTREHPALNLWIQFGESHGGPVWFV